jgi:RNase adapter protein RapZ
MAANSKLRVVIVSGLSGAGKTVALRALEDSGFFCVDNLPVTLIESFLTAVGSGSIVDVGIGVDIRATYFQGDARRILTSIRERRNVEILFLEADSKVIIRRFKETRRPHPLAAVESGMGLEEAAEEEKKRLMPLRESADRILDTSGYTPHQLRYLVVSSYGQPGKMQRLNLRLISFGYKYGIPQNADLLFDVRFLPNPYFIPELKPLNGLNKEVAGFVMSNSDTVDFLERLENLFDFLIPRYMSEGRVYLSIGVGCTGGMHRSPVIVEELTKYFKKRHSIDASIVHRDMS